MNHSILPFYNCNPFLRVAMIQDTVEESKQPRIPYDHRIFLVQERNALLLLNGKEIPIGADTLIYLSVRDRYYFKGKIRAAILNFDMTMVCCDRKQPICPDPKERYLSDLTFDITQVEGFESAIVLTADELLKREVLSIVDTYIQGNAYADALCSAMLKQALTNIRIARQQRKNSHSLLAENVLLYIKDHAAEIDSNQTLSDFFGYHPVYLSTVFKQHFQKTLHETIVEEKLYTASRLLLYTNQSVEEIAFKVGLSTRSYFCTVFKRRFGVTPNTYRKQHTLPYI